MKINQLPKDGENGFHMFAYYDSSANKVEWIGTTNVEWLVDNVALDRALFQVWRGHGKVVIVESVGWYSSDFHYRLELTDLPDRVVFFANHAAGLLETAYDQESLFSNVVQ